MIIYTRCVKFSGILYHSNIYPLTRYDKKVRPTTPFDFRTPYFQTVLSMKLPVLHVSLDKWCVI